jgi:adenylate cyclase
MAHQTTIAAIEDWLIDAALADPEITGLFDSLCHRLRGAGIPLERAVLNWPTLHPLFRAELIEWRIDSGAKLSQFAAEGGLPQSWIDSPFYFVHRNELDFLRRRLIGPERLLDFPVLSDLEAGGFTDYLVTGSTFRLAQVNTFDRGRSGILASWTTRRDTGFSESDVAALMRVQRSFAVACRASLQMRVMKNLARTYLGPTAAEKVLSGDIRLGDGATVNAVVWYSDLRGSTRLSALMKPEGFLDLLRRYYCCTARAVIDEGGEVLDFIGDGVLGIFPVRGELGLPEAVRAATRATERALDLAAAEEAARQAAEPAMRFSIVLAVGPVKFGNVGVPERLVFTAIGEVVNAVTRIDALTKTLGRSVLVTDDIAAVEPDRWVSLGPQMLPDLNRSLRLHARTCTRDAFDAEADEAMMRRSLAG